MTTVTTRTAYPICSMPGCEQEIYLRPEERHVCAACELRGGPPPPVPRRPEPVPAPVPTHLICSRDDCHNFIIDFHDEGFTECTKHRREADRQ
jgi:hypothetical protein